MANLDIECVPAPLLMEDHRSSGNSPSKIYSFRHLNATKW